MDQLHIIATIRCFPESNSLPVVIKNLVSSKIDSFRINIGRDKFEDVINAVDIIKDICRNAIIMLDVSCPKSKIRIKRMASNFINVKAGESYGFVNVEKTSDGIGIDYLGDYEKLKGRQIIYGDGLGSFEIVQADKYVLTAISENSFKMVSGKSLYFNEFNYIDTNDTVYIELQKMISCIMPEYVAFSFIESEDDLKYCKRFLNSNIKIVSKIETLEGIKNIKEISDYCDAVMLGRGDLGVTTPIYKMNYYQENLIEEICNKNLIKYVATDVMSSMKDRFQPSRADIIDVAKIIKDGYDGVVLPAFITDKDNISYTIELLRDIYSVTKNRKGYCYE